MGLAVKIPINVVLVFGFFAGLLASGILSYRYLKQQHALVGVIGLIALMAGGRYAIQGLIAAGLEPLSGPPLFGGLFAIIVCGWIFGFLLTLVEREHSRTI